VAGGRHRFTVRRAGYRSEELTIDTVAGRSYAERVALRLEPVAAPASSVETPAVERAARHRRSRWLAWGAGALGMISVGAGSVEGVLALRDVTGPSLDTRGRGETRAWVADGLFAVGAVAVVTAWRLFRHARSGR
jgi:uncharacterized membrane protein